MSPVDSRAIACVFSPNTMRFRCIPSLKQVFVMTLTSSQAGFFGSPSRCNLLVSFLTIGLLLGRQTRCHFLSQKRCLPPEAGPVVHTSPLSCSILLERLPGSRSGRRLAVALSRDARLTAQHTDDFLAPTWSSVRLFYQPFGSLSHRSGS